MRQSSQGSCDVGCWLSFEDHAFTMLVREALGVWMLLRSLACEMEKRWEGWRCVILYRPSREDNAPAVFSTSDLLMPARGCYKHRSYLSVVESELLGCILEH